MSSRFAEASQPVRLSKPQMKSPISTPGMPTTNTKKHTPPYVSPVALANRIHHSVQYQNQLPLVILPTGALRLPIMNMAKTLRIHM